MKLKTRLQLVDHAAIFKRCLHVFIGAFLGTFIASIVDLLNSFQTNGLNGFKKALLSLLIAAIGAGITALWSYLQQIQAASGGISSKRTC